MIKFKFKFTVKCLKKIDNATVKYHYSTYYDTVECVNSHVCIQASSTIRANVLLFISSLLLVAHTYIIKYGTTQLQHRTRSQIFLE